MIYVRVELWPGGSRDGAQCLGEGLIANDGTGTATRGNYLGMFSKRGGFSGDLATGDVSRVLRRVKFEGFSRKWEHAWKLLMYLIVAAFRVSR